jgi:hypothetical protein
VSTLLVIEDGDDYEEFARLFLGHRFNILVARSCRQALAALRSPQTVDSLLVDLRFDRSPEADLVGDLEATAERLFAGDRLRALRYLQDQQGVLILAELRASGFAQLAVFIHDLPPRRLENLRRLYGAVRAVPTFDAALVLAALEGGG